MRKKNVMKYKGANYPTRELYSLHPALLCSAMPHRWLKKKAAAGALVTFILASLAKCDSNSRLPVSRTLVEHEKEIKPKKENRRAVAKVAPLFIHGNGMGATGCVVVSPPVFLSEAEAWDIILNELRKEGLVFEKKNFRIESVFTEERYPKCTPKDFGIDSYYIKSRSPLYLEAYNPDLNLGLKFIGENNYYYLGGIASISTVSGYNLVSLAQELREKIRENGEVNAAFFFDPMVRLGMDDSLTETEDENRDELREQVREFVKWVKAEFPGNPAARKSIP